jgi:ribosomal subunit interface protein
MDVRIQGTNMELTEELYTFVEAKLEDSYRALGRLDRDPVQVDVELEETTRRHPHELEDQRRYRAEANVTVPGRLIRAEGSGDDIEQAIVAMKHRLTRELREWRERVIDERRAGGRRAKQELGEEIEAERYADIEDDEEARYAAEIEEFEAEPEEDGEEPPDQE